MDCNIPIRRAATGAATAPEAMAASAMPASVGATLDGADTAGEPRHVSRDASVALRHARLTDPLSELRATGPAPARRADCTRRGGGGGGGKAFRVRVATRQKAANIACGSDLRCWRDRAAVSNAFAAAADALNIVGADPSL